jgi:hypothetical protein
MELGEEQHLVWNSPGQRNPAQPLPQVKGRLANTVVQHGLCLVPGHLTWSELQLCKFFTICFSLHLCEMAFITVPTFNVLLNVMV